ncbi:hypothetical protein LXA43DRAFT_238292 [Ganoderma leucocontextum]|nr:hypothetical protein LXA43DRAFT_238292 [Ganoderma leucocontextum]
MRGRNSLSSLLHTSPSIAEPPRKRPRTAERELSPATTDSSPAPSPKSSGAATASSHVSMPLSTPPSTSRPRSRMSMSHLGDILDASGVQMGAPSSSSASGSRSARRSDASRTVANESDSEADRSGATLLEGFSSVFPGAGAGGGDAGGAPPSMKGRRKGKAKAHEEGSDGEDAMAWESIQSDTNSNPCTGQVAAEGGAGVIAKSPFPTQRQHLVDDADGRDLPAREGGQDHMEEPTVRDGEFYIDSADCVIRVDNTLFRVSDAA